jgi:CBS domain-containing protein
MSILVKHAMTESPQTARPDMSAEDAAGLMKQLDVGVIPVAEADEFIGLVTDRDLVTRVLAERKDPAQVRLADIATRSPVTVSPGTRISEARDLMAQHKVRRLPVVKGDRLVGILSLGDVALADASDRALGQTLEEISESPATSHQSDTPTRGTPDRVREARSLKPGG